MIRKTLLVVMAATIQTGFALMRAYSVEPVNAAQSGWTDTIPGYDYISQTLTVNFDSLKRVELFAGEYGNGGAYRLQVLTVPGGAQVAYQNAGTYSRPHHWVIFDNLTFTAPESIVRGKPYEFRYSRSGSDRERTNGKTSGRTRFDFA